MITEISEEDKIQIRRFKEIADRRGIANSKKVQELFNRIFETPNMKATSCAGCIRGRINKLYNKLIEIEKAEQEKKNAEEIKEN